MEPTPIKTLIADRIWGAVAGFPYLESATLTGSFLDSPGLEGISDIDLILVVDHLNSDRFAELQARFDRALRGPLADRGWGLRLNPTLGPLKFNDPGTAVLHLMVYSRDAHVRHVLESPFTCLDWQRSGHYRNRSLADVYPTWGLQPRHFLSARRGPLDYLSDLKKGTVSYRELVCTADGYAEQKREKPMGDRDRLEFAYHVMRFLMQNFLKLVARSNDPPPNDRLPDAYFALFPDGVNRFAALFADLRARKARSDFSARHDLLDELTAFLTAFERQFRNEFVGAATRHIVVRHAPTARNLGPLRFQGRIDEPPVAVAQGEWVAVRAALEEVSPALVFTSPLVRARETIRRLGALVRLPKVVEDERLMEQDYGELDDLAVDDARRRHPAVFAAWERGEDPRLPGGESTGDVWRRVEQFATLNWVGGNGGNTLTCTHNVVIRCLVGSCLGIPPAQRHRIRVPHLVPLEFVRSDRFGLFLNAPADVLRLLLADWERTA